MLKETMLKTLTALADRRFHSIYLSLANLFFVVLPQADKL